MNFTETSCIVCKEKFKENDDIVVCDICGTPYHKECYKKIGKCINVEYHEKGLTFNAVNNKNSTQNEDVTTSYEQLYDKAIIDNYNNFIDNCSEQLLDKVGIDPNEEHQGVKYLEFCLYTKSLNATEKFHRSVNGKKNTSLLTFLLPEYYMISKNMYVDAIFTYLINFVLSLPTVLMYLCDSSENVLYGIVYSIGFKCITVASVVLSVMFRFFVSDKCLKLHFKKCTDNIKAIKSTLLSHKKSYTDFLYKLVNFREGFNLLAVILLGIGSNILYSNFYFILNLILMYFSK